MPQLHCSMIFYDARGHPPTQDREVASPVFPEKWKPPMSLNYPKSTWRPRPTRKYVRKKKP